MHSISNKNNGLNCLKLIGDIHFEINGILLLVKVTPLEIVNMKFTLITSVELEHYFS